MKTIAVSGKGGTGKTTLAALIIHWIKENRTQSILAVDADSNVNLNDLLGVPIKDTVGAIREEIQNSSFLNTRYRPVWWNHLILILLQWGGLKDLAVTVTLTICLGRFYMR
jgi:CO dehydrogenase nickel-insertion accessory protein CooC1